MTQVTRQVYPHARTDDSGQTWNFHIFIQPDMTDYGYAKLDPIDVTFSVPNEETLRGLTVEALRAKLKRVRAEAQAQALELEVEISKMLSIGYEAPR